MRGVAKIGTRKGGALAAATVRDNSCLYVTPTVPDTTATAIIAKTENMAWLTLVISQLLLS